ncbi:MAG TPA: biopolymer transporter ExbD [Candidatus Obscuribacterales bacterium]
MAIGGRAGETFTEINVTPLTDVFLVLLVIMILIAPLVNQTVLKVDPPHIGPAQKADEDKGPKINVDVSANGVIRVNNQPVNPPDTIGVSQAIKAAQQQAGKDDIPLLLSAEGEARQKYVVAVMDAAAGCGIKQLRVLPIKK